MKIFLQQVYVCCNRLSVLSHFIFQPNIASSFPILSFQTSSHLHKKGKKTSGVRASTSYKLLPTAFPFFFFSSKHVDPIFSNSQGQKCEGFRAGMWNSLWQWELFFPSSLLCNYKYSTTGFGSATSLGSVNLLNKSPGEELTTSDSKYPLGGRCHSSPVAFTGTSTESPHLIQNTECSYRVDIDYQLCRSNICNLKASSSSSSSVCMLRGIFSLQQHGQTSSTNCQSELSIMTSNSVFIESNN